MADTRRRFAWWPVPLWRHGEAFKCGRSYMEPAGWLWLRRVIERDTLWFGWVAFEDDQRDA